jgi:H+-transporting ATPase
MKSVAEQTKVPESKARFKPDAPDPKNDLKTLSMPEVEKELASSPDGLSQAEAQWS